MIRALRKDQAFLEDVTTLSAQEDLHLWWLGQSGYLIQYKGKRILIDPYLSDSLTKKYAQTDKPHVRISERVIDPAILPRIDLITSSHLHTDHMDAATILPILSHSPECRLLVPTANRKAVAERLSIDAQAIHCINEGEEFTWNEFHVRALPAAHNTIERDEHGNCLCLGYAITVGPYRLYHSGDTLDYAGLDDHLRRFQPHLAILPINGNDPARKVAGNLNATEAVDLCKRSNLPLMLPCHYDLFAFNTADIREFMRTATDSQQRFIVLELGGRICGRELAD